ncbi:recombinase family protein [Ochrobactrum sp. MC-1LL]|uniref:recombinase family protein n=1 Tax=Ochrobactrum sp. MC-1LL TaxID=2735351 RepID=UPI0014382D5A|nr:recombinase family protein [Ochrobactrum sp. MC-1LL]NKE75033.1 recombinase family protein [Ochrobactrum sp. MC-1LL]
MAKIKAVAYLRTSSATNVGNDKDSDKRQLAAINRYAKANGFEIVDCFYDAAVSGADPIESRPGFTALLDRIEGNVVRTVIVEDASRFARDLTTQELGIVSLIKRGVTVLTSSGDNLTETDDPFKIAMRQIAGSFAQLEKARLVSKLKAARDRKRQNGKCEGRKSFAEMNPDLVALAKKEYRASLKTRKPLSLRRLAIVLAGKGYVASNGKPYSAQSIKNMLG